MEISGLNGWRRLASKSMDYPHHAHVAPVWKRCLASLVDSLPGLTFAVVQIRRRDFSKPPRVVATVMQEVYEVAAPSMFGRTVGQRVCNIRVVSQETGRSPTLKQVLVMRAVVRVPSLVVSPLWRPESRQLKQMKALNVEVEQLKQEHRNDPGERNRAIRELCEGRNVKPFRAFLSAFLPLIVSLTYGGILYVSRRRDPLHQGLAERRAKILPIDDRPSSFRRLAALFGRRKPVPSAGRLIHLVPIRKRSAA